MSGFDKHIKANGQRIFFSQLIDRRPEAVIAKWNMEVTAIMIQVSQVC